MTEEQAARIKQLSEKYHFSSEPPQEQLLSFIGVGLGLSIGQIESYLEPKDMNIMDRHYRMLMLALHIEADMDGGEMTPLEKLKTSLARYYLPGDGEDDTDYRQLMQYILDHAELSAAKIALLREAAAKHIPQKELLKLARSNKEPMELQRSIEFYEVIQGKSKASKKGKAKQRQHTILPRFRNRTPKQRLDKMSKRKAQK